LAQQDPDRAFKLEFQPPTPGTCDTGRIGARFHLPLKILEAATMTAARAPGIENESGSLEVGKRADVLLHANPLAEMRNTRAIGRIVAAEVVSDPSSLCQRVGFGP
jgi:hypothetical protein